MAYSTVVYGQVDTLHIEVGGRWIDGTKIKPYTNKWKVSFIDSSGNVSLNRIWTDYSQIIELEGKKYLHRVQDLYSPKMELQDTWINMVDYKTLVPKSFSTITPKGSFTYYEFENGKIEGHTNKNQDNELKEVNTDLNESVFDWNLYGILLLGLPLKEDLVAKLPFYNSRTNSRDWLVASVVGKSKLKLPGGEETLCWELTTNQNLTFWISEEAPYVIKLELALPNSSKLVWEMF